MGFLPFTRKKKIILRTQVLYKICREQCLLNKTNITLLFKNLKQFFGGSITKQKKASLLTRAPSLIMIICTI